MQQIDYTMPINDVADDNAIIDTHNADHGHPQMRFDNFCLEEAMPMNGEIVDLGSAGEALTRVELDVACSTEKLLNLEVLLMHVGAKAGDHEALALENKDISSDSIEKALEFDILSGILDSEVKAFDNFLAYLQKEIVDTRGQLSSCEHLKDFTEIEKKLNNSEESLKQSQEQVSEMKMQSAKFQRVLAFGGQEIRNIGNTESSGNDQFAFVSSKGNVRTAEQQRHVLIMLENSLARELDLEKKLSESRSNKDDLELKLQYVEEEMSFMEGMEEITFQRLYEAENAGVVLYGISKEMIGKLHIMQFNLNSSIHRESELRSKLQLALQKMSSEESAIEKLRASYAELDNLFLLKSNELISYLKKSEEKYILANSEALTLREKVKLLEEQLNESDMKLQHAVASIEATQEQQNLLNSELSDMEDVIEDLKGRALKAEVRADNAEAKCILLTETNLELNEELAFLRDKIENLEGSLHQACDAKIEAAEDVKIRSKLITDMVMQLAAERERLHIQISSLVNEKNLLAEKCWDTRDDTSIITNHSKNENGKSHVCFKNDAEADLINATCLRTLNESEISAVDTSVKSVAVCGIEVEPAKSAVDGVEMVSHPEIVRTIEAGQIKSKYVLMAILVPVISMLIIYLNQRGNCF